MSRLRGYREEKLKGFYISDDDLLAYNIDPKSVTDEQFMEISQMLTDCLQEHFAEYYRFILQEIGLL